MLLRFFVFESRTVLPDGHHSGIIAVSKYRSVNAFLHAFCAGLNFFHQKFWMPSIPCAVQFFHLAISFFVFSSDDKFTHKICSLAQFSFHLFHPQHMPPRCLPKTQQIYVSPAFYFHCFQFLKKAFLVLLEHDVIFLLIAFFNVFLQLHLLVTKLIKPLLFNDS